MITMRIHQQAGPPLTLRLQVTDTNSLNILTEDLSSILRKGIERDGGDARLFDKLLRKSMALTDMLLTTDLQKQLATLPARTALTITAQLAEHRIPFELLRVGDEFLGERFAVGRVTTDAAGSSEVAASMLKYTLASVIVSEAFELVSANTERTIVERRLRQLSHDFPALIQMQAMHLGPLTLATFLQTLEESRWLHFAGHATEVAGQRVLRLHESPAGSKSISVVEQLTPADMQDLCRTPEAVFLNACGALQLPDSNNGIPTSSLVSEFLRLGTKWLLGPIVPVLDSQTRYFTTEFYDSISNDCGIGEAMRRARLEARRALGPHNLLPLSYVLYGDPSTSPFPMAASMQSTQRSDDALETLPMLNELEHGSLIGTMGLKTRPELNDRSFPCTCIKCGHTIETRHGVGNSSAVLQGESAVCVACHRNRDIRRATASEIPREAAARGNWSMTGNVQAASPPPTAGWQATNSTNTAVQTPLTEKPAFITFQRHLEECLNRASEWKDIQSGKHRSCTFRRSESKPVADKQAERNSLTADKKGPESTWLANYTVVDQAGRTLADMQVVVPEYIEQGSATPVTTAELKSLLAEIDASNSQTSQIVFICSLSGFDSALLQELAADTDPLWYRPGLTIYLHDISSNQTHFRSTDLNAYRLAHLLQRESTGRQFQQAVQWIEDQLPLVTSLGRDEILRNLKCETDAVEAAMRHVGATKNLHIDETKDFGLVLSERNLNQVDAADVVPDKGTLLGRVSAALRKPFRPDGKRTE